MNPWTGRRAFLTGGTGYLGVHLAKALAARGAALAVSVRPSSALCRLRRAAPAARPIVIGETQELADAIRNAAPDVLFHLAAPDRRVPASACFAQMEAMAFAVAAAQADLPRMQVVNAGTWWEWDEAGRFAPRGAYAEGKARQRAILDEASCGAAKKAVTVVPYDIYGPDDWRDKLLPALLRAARKAEPVALTSGRQRMDWVHVEDGAEAFVTASDLGRADQPSLFTAGSGTTLDLVELVDLMRAHGARFVAQWGALPYRDDQRMAPSYPAPPVPGWTPQWTMARFLRETLADG